MLVAPLAAMGQVTTVFQDAFTSGSLSTLNPTATSPGTLTSARTAYEIAASKSATSTTIASGVMTFGNFSTSSGYCEGQALFTASPVTLNTAGQYIEFYYTFTATTTLFSGNANDNEQVSLGLYNSGGSGPTNGTALWNSGLASGSTAGDIGCVKGWQGYCGMIAYTKSATLQPSAIYTRPAQTGANNLNQGLCPVSGYSSAVNLVQLTGVQGQPALTVGNQYTLDLKIYYVNSTTLAITNTLYNGAGIGGSVYSAGGFTAQNGATVTGANVLTNAFDGLCIGFRPTSSPTTAETMQINKVTVLEVTPIAPSITGLTNETVVAGTSPTLSPTVTGVPTPAYQWYLSTDGGVTSNALSYATGSSLTLTNVQYSQNNYIYSLVATNSQGTNASSMTLSVIVTPSITGLNNQAANVGDTVSISPTVAGVPAPTLQWRTNGVNLTDGSDANGSIIAGSQTSTLYITNAQVADSVTYSLVASNSAGIVTNSMNLTVAAGSQLPVITGPTNITVIQGNNGTFSASASGVPVPTLQWLDQTQTPIPGATGTSLVLANVQYSQNGYTYYVVASNSVGSVTNSATLTVIVSPAITSQPSSLVVTNTQSASFTVGASGVPAVAYQWYKNGSPISSAANNTATNATFAIASVSPTDTATYSVTITNQAGTTNSVTVTLTVNSTISATAFAPTNGATGVCYDTPLSVTFSQAPTLRTNGTIKIFNVTNSATPVDTINLALNAANGTQAHSVFSGDSQGFNYYPVVINGSTAVIYPHGGVMTSNQTYYVTIDDGAFADASGAYFAGITATNVWQFTTKVGGPANPTNMVVDASGNGDFVTVQGAVDSVPAANTTPRLINIHNGNYFEIVDISGKNNLLLRGQSRAATIVGYPNNAAIAAGGSTHSRMAFKVNANDISLDNLTVTNMTPQDVSQAEALMVESGAARLIVNNCNIDSYQDTILANISTSKAYFYNSLIQGDVDFIWGGGNLFFTNCEIRYLIRNANAAAEGPNPSPNASTDISSNGFSFVSCRLTTLPGANPNDTIGRTRGITNGNTALINCMISTNIGGWASDAIPTSNFRNWYYGCTNDLGASVTLSNGIALAATDPNLTNASSSTIWLYGWVPQLSPNILTNPVSQSISGGGTATFTVAATGISDPTYQWLKNGSPIAGQTGSSLTISSASANDAASYSVIVSNSVGVVTSTSASLTVGNTAPTFTPVPNQTVNVGANVSVANVATDPDVPAETLAFTLPVAPSGAAVDGSGNFTWRPTVSFAGTTNAVQVVVTDSGTPNLSATNSFNVIVNPLTQPVASSSAYSGGQFNVTISGQIGPDYELQGTTNLAGGTWTSIATTNSPASSPFILTDPNAAALPVQFYRIVTGPPLP